jgi:hypothetical protein
MEPCSIRAAPSGSRSATRRFISRFADLGIDLASPGNHNRAVPSGWRDFLWLAIAVIRRVQPTLAPVVPAWPCARFRLSASVMGECPERQRGRTVNPLA